MLKNQPKACRGACNIEYGGKPICNKGVMKLFGVGKWRFHTINHAARNGAPECPYDNRHIPKEAQPPSQARQIVHQFLMELYLQAAEVIPDGLNSNKRPRQGTLKFDRKGMDRSGIKHLPPGSIQDYYVQCVSQHPGVTISRKLFSSDPWGFDSVPITFQLFLYIFHQLQQKKIFK